ncbi:MAG: F0F1 ATP synthase subunit A [Magnetococcales bacterium]|nr:F0F1 ATP synthase subunit A [Magnetococcales bacterium]MBF0612693.1 F0F1 ATP synthase subunit A [Magnetococcales bacterium]NGZ27106.1 F0F1 ATP synthase subunit A [Magnetococcales bacterium]
MITEAFAAEAGAPKLDPLHHFTVEPIIPIHIFGVDLSISNSVIWMWLAVAAAYGFFRFCFGTPSLVPGRAQSMGEMLYGFVYGIVKETIGKEGEKFFPYILSLFFFVLFCNWLGLIPFSFTPTSQIIVTGTLAMAVFIISTAIGFIRHGLHFFHFFVPSGVPAVLLPLIVPIELISYLARPVSLSVRLFANMTAGHTIIATMLFFTVSLPWFGSWLPFSFAILISGAELFIGAIQAYIFTVLTCVYINDAIHMH